MVLCVDDWLQDDVVVLWKAALCQDCEKIVFGGLHRRWLFVGRRIVAGHLHAALVCRLPWMLFAFLERQVDVVVVWQ